MVTIFDVFVTLVLMSWPKSLVVPNFPKDFVFKMVWRLTFNMDKVFFSNISSCNNDALDPFLTITTSFTDNQWHCDVLVFDKNRFFYLCLIIFVWSGYERRQISIIQRHLMLSLFFLILTENEWWWPLSLFRF